MVKTLSLVERTGTNSVFYLNSFAMDSKQVGKAILVILSYTTLGIEQRTFSYLGSFSYHRLTIEVSVDLIFLFY